jgi:hypothetical protein
LGGTRRRRRRRRRGMEKCRGHNDGSNNRRRGHNDGSYTHHLRLRNYK